jgi:hypothetical protein
VSEISLSSQFRRQDDDNNNNDNDNNDNNDNNDERPPQYYTTTARQDQPLVQVQPQYTRRHEEERPPLQSLDSEQVHQILEIFPRASKERVQGLLKQQHSIRTIINLLAEESFSQQVPSAQHVEGRPLDGKKSTDDDDDPSLLLTAFHEQPHQDLPHVLEAFPNVDQGRANYLLRQYSLSTVFVMLASE